jgi:DNA primase
MPIAKNKEELRQRLDLVDVVGGYVSLKRASANSYKGLCPFHADKNPSMTVTPHMGLWQCWSCGAKGDVFGFVMQIENIDFPTAIEQLAAKIGFTLEYEEGRGAAQDSSNRGRILAINQAAAEFFKEQLATEEAAIARQNLLDRGFDKAAAELFGVGYSPNSYSALNQHLKAKGFTDQELIESTLVRSGDRGIYDFYRGRLMWPIRDAAGAVIGFGARKLLETDKGPKYYNSSDSPVYHKNKVLYGIDLARAAIGKKKQVVVVEGYTDVMACHLAGVDTAVATCGTSFTDEHVTVINRLLGNDGTGEVIFCFDPDEAGQKAAMRAWEQSSRFTAQTFVAVGPNGLDPCDLRTQSGNEAVELMIKQRKPIYEFMVRQHLAKFDLSNVAGRIAAAKSAATIIAAIRDTTSRAVYERELAVMVSLDPQEIRQIVEEAVKNKAKSGVAGLRRNEDAQTPAETSGAETAGDETQPAPAAEFPPINLQDPMIRVERQVLEVLVQVPESYSESALKRILDFGFVHPAHNALVQPLRTLGFSTEHDHAWLLQLKTQISDRLQQVVDEIASATLPAATEADLARYSQGVITGALDRTLTFEKNDLLAEMRTIDPEANRTRFTEIQQRLVSLEADRRAIRGG